MKILQITQTQTTAVSLLQLMAIGGSQSARMNTVLFANQVCMILRCIIISPTYVRLKRDRFSNLYGHTH